MGFVGALVVFFLLMVWVELGSVVVVFGWVFSVAIVPRVRRLHDVDDVFRVQLALVSRCVVGGYLGSGPDPAKWVLSVPGF